MRPIRSDTTDVGDEPSVTVALGSFAGIVLAAVISAMFMSAHGVASRRLPAVAPGEPPYVSIVSTAAAVLEPYEATGIRGAILVHAGRTLGYAGISSPPPVGLTLPLTPFDYAEWALENIDASNFIWVLAKTGRVRRVHYVMAPADFAAKVEEGLSRGLPGIAPDRASIRANNEGFVRHISTALPSLSEPIVLQVEAGYFVNGSLDELLGTLKSSRTPVAAVIGISSADDPTVTDEAREEFRRFIELARTGGLR